MQRIVFLLLILSEMTSCNTTYHVVGNGVQSTEVVMKRKRATYLLDGIISLNKKKADSKNLVPEGVKDYSITTHFRELDLLVNFVSGFFLLPGFQMQTITVKYDKPKEEVETDN